MGNKRLFNFQLDESIESNIVEREEELLELNNLLDRNRVVQITDIEEVGKTALAKLNINRYHKSYDVII